LEKAIRGDGYVLVRDASLHRSHFPPTKTADTALAGQFLFAVDEMIKQRRSFRIVDGVHALTETP
jgi:hypothetical protein